ncbi:MAG: class I SAM-dependent methyltransferase [Candidatus Thermoplasmatota archaeon]|nr:class I SAM-dependent methyltransferase [Candidatus Thermoplasmatota archaeon]
MSNDIKKWLDQMGKLFLMDVGIRQKQIVLDLGCGVGNYAIPAAGAVGRNGKVYAVDKNREPLDELTHRTKKRGLENVEMVEVSGESELPMQDESVDVVLLYDVIHLVNNRKRLLADVYRVLKPDALVSVYPKHHQEHMNMELDDVKNEIESARFHFERMIYKMLIHDNCLEQGYVLNFRKL